jgi:CheY-like chemotaxis protein
MSVGGTISIAVDNELDEAVQGAGEYVRLTVADSGCGMPPEVMSRVFEPFFTTKDVGKGSGLGLTQVYGFVQQSGGRIELRSEVGGGTVVVVRLPRAHSEPAAPRPGGGVPLNGPEIARGRRGEVLLVEDDGEVAAMTSEMLRSIGYGVIHAASPEAALGALANARPVDAVISDIMMPGGVSGLALAREIRRRQPDLPVILVTGFAEAAAGLEDGQFSLLLKPYTAEALANALVSEIR